MKVYILGAGPTALAIAHELAENKISFEVLERAPQVGGLATTLEWKKHGYHDLGPHKIFTQNQELMTKVKSLLPNESWLVRPKKSSIYMRGHYLPYPPSPFSLIAVYGIASFLKMTTDYGLARLRQLFGTKKTYTFEEDLKQRVGDSLYLVLFKPIALKLWGNPTKLDVKLSQGRVQTPKLSEVIGRLIGLKKDSNFEALTFLYPKGGLIKIWQSILELTKGSGQFTVNCTVTHLEEHDGRIKKIICESGGRPREIALEDDDFVFSTLPMQTLNTLLPNLPAKLSETINNTVTLNDLNLVFLKLKETNLIDESWVFIPDPNVIFHRISEQESFDPSMTPNGSIVCCEIMNSETRPTGHYSDEDLISKSISDLRAMGYSAFTVEDSRVIKLPKSYPVFRPGFESELNTLLEHIDSYHNFRTIGRQGAFNYIGTLDAMDIGYGAAAWLVKYKDAARWKQERRRTEHFPILD